MLMKWRASEAIYNAQPGMSVIRLCKIKMFGKISTYLRMYSFLNSVTRLAEIHILITLGFKMQFGGYSKSD